MNIDIIGGGPAGLYFAILMKKADHGHRIRLFERNPPDATFGWGVVFSDKTLSYLRDADPESHDQIVSSFETWDNVDVVHLTEKITIRGNRFSGIARIKLLNILQNRCDRLGVELHFQTEVRDIDVLASKADLVIGADGVNSAVRSRYEQYFEPSLSIRPNKYIWFGTNRLFHGLTLTFRENEDGVFAAHSYKFDKSTSTFIVECDQQTWNAAGFENRTDEDTREYLENVFARDLDDNPLLSNNSKWINFLNVRNATWHHRNVVLLGDALHTAHFSIGSGTKLALEDAIALAECFREKAPLSETLALFESRRKPIIEEYQEAARESLVWFENARKYMHLSPMDLAYSLMTRSKRIDYDNLKRRDPEFISAYDHHIEAKL